MSKVLVFNIPAYGHVNPTLPVVGQLAARGEQVIYYLTEEFKPQVRHAGASFRRIDDSLRVNAPSMPQRMVAFLLQLKADSLRLVPRLIDRVRAEEADYVIYDGMCLWGRALTELLGLPAVRFSPLYAMNEHSSLSRQMSSRWSSFFDEATSVELAQALSDFQDASQQLHERYGLAPLRPTDLLTHTEALNIFTLPRQFQPDAGAFDERYLFVGPCIAPRSDASRITLNWPTERQVLYISLGTLFNDNPEFFAACFDAFADSDWQVVLSIGTKITPSTIGRTPANFLISPHVPQLEILQRADMFITHGGMNSTMEAIYYGVPMVVVPQQPEQAMTATYVADLGLGVALEPEQATSSALRDAVNEVSGDASYRSRISHMQKAAHEAGGYLRAADAIQQFGYQHTVNKAENNAGAPAKRDRSHT